MASKKIIISTRRAPRPIFTIRLRPEPGIDPVRALRAALKTLLRRFGLKAIEVKEETARGRVS